MKMLLRILALRGFTLLRPFFFLLLAGTAAQAQTLVTGTITDSLLVPYSFCTIQATLTLPGGSPLPSGPTTGVNIPVPSPVAANCDVNGSFTISLQPNASITPAATVWEFRVNVPGVAPPLGTGPQSFTVQNITIAGASQSVSAVLTAAAPRLTTITFSGGSGCAPAGAANQLLTDNGAGGCTAQANLTFNGALLNITGGATASGTLTGTTSVLGGFFGPTAGTIATAGLLRAANNVAIVSARNAANSANFSIALNGSNLWDFGATGLTNFTTAVASTSITAPFFSNGAAGQPSIGIFRFANNVNALCTTDAAVVSNHCIKMDASDRWDLDAPLIVAGGGEFTGNVLSGGFFAPNSGTIAGAGLLRAINNFTIAAARNAGNSADLTFGTNASDEFIFNAPLRINTGASGVITFEGSASGSAALGVANAAGTPNRINLPTATGSAGQCLTTDGANPQQLSWAACGGTPPFSDATALVSDNGDPTKLALFEASGITTATTRTYTLPNRNTTLAGNAGTITGVTGQVARFDANGDLVSPATSGSVIVTSATTSAIDVRPGDVTGNNAGGTLTIRGANSSTTGTGSGSTINITGGAQTAAATGGVAGPVNIAGGDSAGNASATAGHANIRPGGGSAATPAAMGRLVISETYGDGGTVTSGLIQCAAGNLTVADCATSATNPLGLAISASDTNPVIVQWAGRNNVAITLDVTNTGDCNGTNCTTTVGHYVCTSANVAGQVQVATGPATAPCAANRLIGRIVVAETTVTSLAIGAVSLRVAN